MSIFGVNKFIVEQQITRARLQSGDKNLELQGQNDVKLFPSLGSLTHLQTQKFTPEEIQEVETYIQEQRSKYPGSLEDLFALWERLVKERKDILLGTRAKNTQLVQDIESEKAKPIPAESKNTLKYSLKAYEGYAIQELQKSGKTIKDLQEKLKEKKIYIGDVDGKFDQVTLDAIMVFQKTIPNAKYGVDGLVGSEETIPALFGLPVKANTVKKDESTPRKKPTPPSTPRVTGETGSTTNQPPELLRRPATTPNPTQPNQPPSQPVAQSSEVVSEKLPLPTAILFRDGAYYMIGKNGNPKKIEYAQYSESPAFKENIEAQQKRLPLVKDIAIFLEAYSAENPKESQRVETAWNRAMEFLQKGSSNPQQVTNQIVVDTLGAHWGSAKWYNMFAIKDDGQRRVELYKLIKDMGQYEMVVQRIAGEYTRKLTPENIKEMQTSLEQGGNYRNYFSQESADKIAKEMTEIKSSYQKAWNENKKSYIAAYKQEFKISTELTPAQLKKAEDNFMDKGLDQALRMAVLKTDLAKTVNWKGDHKDPTMDLASSILGTGTFNMSSRMARESTKMIAIEAIALAAGAFTMGAGTVAIHALSATRFARLATMGTEAGSLARLGVATLGNGVAFELGHGGAKSLIEGQNMYSQRGFVDSILFTGVLGGVNKLLSGTNKLAQWSQVGGKGVQFAKGVLIEGTALNIAGVTSKIAFQDNVVWSPEEIAQAFLMSALFRGANVGVNAATNKLSKGKTTPTATETNTATNMPTNTATNTATETNTFTATKNTKGEIEVKTTTQESSVQQPAQQPQSAHVETHTTSGKSANIADGKKAGDAQQPAHTPDNPQASSTHNLHGEPVAPMSEPHKATQKPHDSHADSHGSNAHDSHASHGLSTRAFIEKYLTSGDRDLFNKKLFYSPTFWKEVNQKGWPKEIVGYLKDQTIDQLFNRILKAVDASKLSIQNVKNAEGIGGTTKAVIAVPFRYTWEWLIKLPLAPSKSAIGLTLGVGAAEGYHVGSQMSEDERNGRSEIVAGWDKMIQEGGSTLGVIPDDLLKNYVQSNLLGWLGVFMLNYPEAPGGVSKMTTEEFFPKFVDFLETVRNTGQMAWAIPTQWYDANNTPSK